MNIFFSWSDAFDPSRREMIFEGRNKEFGAYEIRKHYTRRVASALLLTTLCFIVIISLPLISGILTKRFNGKTKITEAIELGEPPPIDKNAPPPPPPIVEPPPLRQTIKFTPPLVVETVHPDEVVPTQDEVKLAQVSTTTQEGLDIVDLPPDPGTNQAEEEVFTLVEEMPSFPGGDRKLTELLSHIRYPQIARENSIAGSVFLSFIVDKDGKIKDAKVLKGIGGGCDEEALRVLMTLPNWNPGKQNGRPVPVRSSVRVNFALQ